MAPIRLNTNSSENRLADMISRVQKINKNDELVGMVREAKEKYGVKNISFAGFNLGALTLVEPISVWTYNPEWIDHYRRRNYLEVDPVVKTVPRSILPVDWAQFDRRDRIVKKFFMEAKEAGVGSHGISIPVRGRNRDFSIFSLTFDETEKDWAAFKQHYMAEFQVLSVYFHQSMLRANKVEIPEFNLTNREQQVLFWAACGKTADETAVILGISKRGIRFHTSNILTKLNSVNIAHAVGKAVYYNLINPPR